jgi:hypothetical protein
MQTNETANGDGENNNYLAAKDKITLNVGGIKV